MSYDDFKLATPPTYEIEQLVKCECCSCWVDELYTVRVPFLNIVKKEYYCLECATNYNDNERNNK